MEYRTTFLIIGSGLAGLTFALKVAEFGEVALVTKKGLTDSNTTLAQGGIASVLNAGDSFDLHIKDTLEAGDGLCHRDVAELVIQNGPERIQELMDWGVRFSAKEGVPGQDRLASVDSLDLGREGGHSKNRVVHAKDMTGNELERVLAQRVRENPRITVFEHHIAIDLITFSTRVKRGSIIASRKDECHGAYVLCRQTNRVITFCAKKTLLATGGTGKVYLYTSNPDIATGDGIAMAYRAGAKVANLEFVQFHPTCLFHPDAKNFLISEAVRGEGGVLMDINGRAFMHQYDPQKDLACRDVVARAIDRELKRSGADSVFLDISHRDANFIKTRFPNLYKKCLAFGKDMTKEPIPVVPAAHYMCGGVVTDTFGRTNIAHLLVVGESACTGLHGANRLASNSLLEALVYAKRASESVIPDIKGKSLDLPELPLWDEMETTDSDEAIMVAHNWDEIRRLMWNYVGIVRSNKRLDRARRRIQIIQKEIHTYYWNFKVTADLIELRNIALVAELIIKCAKMRAESRGLHYNIAYPGKNDSEWLKDTVLERTAGF